MAQSEAASTAPMTTMQDLVFLFDVDNTLLDNDRVQADLATYLTEAYGVDAGKLYWDIFEQLRGELGYADYLGALERFRLECQVEVALSERRQTPSSAKNDAAEAAQSEGEIDDADDEHRDELRPDNGKIRAAIEYRLGKRDEMRRRTDRLHQIL